MDAKGNVLVFYAFYNLTSKKNSWKIIPFQLRLMKEAIEMKADTNLFPIPIDWYWLGFSSGALFYYVNVD